MGFKLLILHPGQGDGHYDEDWSDRLRQAIPDVEVNLCSSVGEAMEEIGDADAAFGNIVPELFERAKKLRWVACPQAGPRAGYYHRALVDSDVVVTNTREIYNDHISAHIMSFVLARIHRWTGMDGVRTAEGGEGVTGAMIRARFG